MYTGRPPGPGPPPEPGPGPRSRRAPRPGLWRWRRNPLRRPEDIIEAWIIVLVWIVAVVGGAIAGTLSAHATEDALARQRAERHHVTAQLIEDAPRSSAISGQDGEKVRAAVRWTGPDGDTHTGHTLVEPGHHAGYRFKVWADRHGQLTTSPPGAAESTVQTVLLGGSAGAAFCGLTYLAGRGVRLGIDRHRAARWDKEWEVVEPHWGHRMG